MHHFFSSSTALTHKVQITHVMKAADGTAVGQKVTLLGDVSLHHNQTSLRNKVEVTIRYFTLPLEGTV
jgi:hypothetical protein